MPADKGAGENGPRVRALPESDAPRHKKAASAPSASVKEARAARGAAKTAKKRAAAKPATKKPVSRKKR
jgi:ribonuclease R